MTKSYATIEVSEATYCEIKTKLEVAGYSHLFRENHNASSLPIILMDGLALSHEIEMTQGESPEY